MRARITYLELTLKICSEVESELERLGSTGAACVVLPPMEMKRRGTQWSALPGNCLRRQEMRESGPYGRLGGAFAIRSVLDHFSDVPYTDCRRGIGESRRREWHHDPGQTPGRLELMRSLWLYKG